MLSSRTLRVVVSAGLLAASTAATVIPDWATVLKAQSYYGLVDLHLSVQPDPSGVRAGSTSDLLVTLANNGPDTATAVSWSDSIPAGLQPIGVNGPPAWDCSGTTPTVATCSIASMALGDSATFTFDTTVEGVYQYSLPNGLKVVLVPDESSPKTTVNMTIFVGSRNEGYGEKGMAHLLEHMLFKGTAQHPDPKKELTLHAEDANGTTWFDRTNYYETVKATDKDVEWAIRFEADRLVNSKVDKKDLDSEMTVVRNEWEIGENNPVSVLSDRVMATAYTWHNYANTTIGDRSDVEKVPIDNLKAFYKKYYRPDNTMLVVAGKLDPEKTFKWIADSFGKLTNPKLLLAGTWTEEPVQDGEKSVTVRRVGGVPVLQVGYHVPAGADPDFPAIDVLTNVLGDSPAGRLYTALVATKKASSINCSDYQLKEPGYFWCTVELHPSDKMENVRQLTVDTIEGLAKKPITAAEVERAKTAELKQIELILNDSTRIGLTLTECAAMGDWRLLYFMRDRLKGVTADDVNQAAAKYLKQSNRTTGEYVPTEHPERSEVPPAPNVSQVL